MRSVEEYFEEFELSRNRLELDEDSENLMAQFLDGLSERISHKVEQHPYHDLKDILHHAIQAEQHIKKKSYATRKNRINQTWDQNRAQHQTPTTFPPKATDKGKAVAVDTRFNSKAPEPNQGKFSNPSASRTRDITCFKCKGRGHMARECPNPRVMIMLESGEYESQDEADTEMIETSTEEVDCEAEYGESLVIRRVLNLMVHPDC
ncbi:hypothetical protein V5N11_015562 [Cardamine amara subsp. amara]|uniref:CCHC-type domain-containing protein n=1 Tax=Cardamine amara subsp. amara TaxID=228776 RepID=A0ABD0ZU33_CARAN